MPNVKWEPSDKAVVVAGDYLESRGWGVWRAGLIDEDVERERQESMKALRVAIRRAWRVDHA